MKIPVAALHGGENPLDVWWHLPQREKDEVARLVEAFLLYQFPIIELLREQRPLKSWHGSLGDARSIIAETRVVEIMAGDRETGRLRLIKPQTEKVESAYSELTGLEVLALEVGRRVSSPTRNQISIALTDYEAAGRLAPIQYIALERVKAVGAGYAEGDLAGAMARVSDYGGFDEFPSLESIRPWVMANFFKPKDLPLWELLFLFQIRGERVIYRETNDPSKSFAGNLQFARDELASLLNAMGVGIHGNFRWDNASIKELTVRYKDQVLKTLQEQLPPKNAAE